MGKKDDFLSSIEANQSDTDSVTRQCCVGKLIASIVLLSEQVVAMKLESCHGGIRFSNMEKVLSEKKFFFNYKNKIKTKKNIFLIKKIILLN